MPTSSIPASGGGGLIPKYQKFTSSGTFTLPDGYGAAKPLVITIQVIGGGGGGSGSVGAHGFNSPTSVRLVRTDYFGSEHAFFPVNIGTLPSVGGTTREFSANQNGWGGGSGGIAQTQMALTGPLTITVGAAGTRSTSGGTAVPRFRTTQWGRGGSNNTAARTYTYDFYDTTGGTTNAGGTGGTSTAGAVSATGGAGGGGTSFSANVNNGTGTVTFPADVSIDSGNSIGPYNTTLAQMANFGNASGGNNGSAGQPAGSAGSATPLLGALAGGSGTTTPVYGAFGVGGIRGDLGTATGVEGTGGGYGAIGASGAVIISYWA